MKKDQSDRPERAAQDKQEKDLAFHRVLLSVGIMGMASTLTFANLPPDAKTPVLISSDSLAQKSDLAIKRNLNERKAETTVDDTASNFALDSILLNGNSSEAARLGRFLSKNEKTVDSSELETFLRQVFPFLTSSELSQFLAFIGTNNMGETSGSNPTTFPELFNEGTMIPGSLESSFSPDPPQFQSPPVFAAPAPTEPPARGAPEHLPATFAPSIIPSDAVDV